MPWMPGVPVHAWPFMHLPLRRVRASQVSDESEEAKSRLETAGFGFPGKPGLEAKTKLDENFHVQVRSQQDPNTVSC